MSARIFRLLPRHLEVAPTASAANPHLSGSVIVPELTIGGSVGGANNRTFTFQGTGARTWATS